MRFINHVVIYLTALLSLISNVSFAITRIETTPRIYCAGPLFNAAERAEMQEIATVLEQAGFKTFLPQRDGIEGYKLGEYMTALGYDMQRSKVMVDQAIFALDTYQVLINCQAVVANLRNRGILPDDGTISEASMAWAYRKPLVFFKAGDPQTTLKDINALVYGLSNFQTSNQMENLANLLKEKLAAQEPVEPHENHFSPIVLQGQELWQQIQMHREKPESERIAAIANQIASLFG